MTSPVPPSQPVSAQPGPTKGPEQDPTALTTQLVDRAILAYERLMNARLDGMDRATVVQADSVASIAAQQIRIRELLREDVDRQLTALREYLLTEIGRVADVTRERFGGVEQQFSQRDIALAAALAAQKEAVREQNTANDRAFGKSESNQVEQIRALTVLTTTSIANINDRITEIKERLDRAPGELARETKTDRKSDISQTWLVVGVLVSAVAVIVTIILSRGG